MSCKASITQAKYSLGVYYSIFNYDKKFALYFRIVFAAMQRPRSSLYPLPYISHRLAFPIVSNGNNRDNIPATAYKAAEI